MELKGGALSESLQNRRRYSQRRVTAPRHQFSPLSLITRHFLTIANAFFKMRVAVGVK